MSRNKPENTARPAEQDDEAVYERLVAEEGLILEAQMEIIRSLNDRGLTQADLARKLGVSESYISQMLGLSARNLTLRTIARIAHALGEPAHLSLGSRPDRAAHLTAAEMTPVAEAMAVPVASSEPWGEVIELSSRARKGRSGSRSARAYASHLPTDLFADAA